MKTILPILLFVAITAFSPGARGCNCNTPKAAADVDPTTSIVFTGRLVGAIGDGGASVSLFGPSGAPRSLSPARTLRFEVIEQVAGKPAREVFVRFGEGTSCDLAETPTMVGEVWLISAGLDAAEPAGDGSAERPYANGYCDLRRLVTAVPGSASAVVAWREYQLQLVTTLASLPAAIRTALAVDAAGHAGVADRGEPFNAGDVVYDNTPGRRFLVAGHDGDVWLVAIERGGYGHSGRVHLFVAGEPRGDWPLANPGEWTTLPDIVKSLPTDVIIAPEAGATSAELPADATAFIERLSSCHHFAGEFNGDGSEHDREVNATMTGLRCDAVATDAAAIRAKYAASAAVLGALEAAEAD